jgi:hypothetical protein
MTKGRKRSMTAQRTFSLDDYRANPARFIAEILIDPGTGKPFELLPAERAFLDHAFRTDAGGRLIYPEQVFSAPKKSGKTGFAALHTLTMCLLFGGQYAEGYCTRVPPAPIQQSARLTNCGDTRRSDHAACGMRWFRHQHARSHVG